MNTIGRYDQRIQFITEGHQSDGAGGTIPVETILLETFAAIEQLPQSRSIEQVQMMLPSTYRVNVMARSGFTPEAGTRVKWNGSTYNIITAPVVDSTRKIKQWTFDITR